MGGWGGWAKAGGIIMVVVGAFRALSGLIGLFNDQWVSQRFTGYFPVSWTGTAAWMLIIGLILLFGGVAVLRGRKWGRTVGIVVTALAAFCEIFWMPIYPLWSIAMIVLLLLVNYGLLVTRWEAEE
jgi:hypothetical protein